jgi:hypothetical protein
MQAAGRPALVQQGLLQRAAQVLWLQLPLLVAGARCPWGPLCRRQQRILLWHGPLQQPPLPAHGAERSRRPLKLPVLRSRARLLLLRLLLPRCLPPPDLQHWPLVLDAVEHRLLGPDVEQPHPAILAAKCQELWQLGVPGHRQHLAGDILPQQEVVRLLLGPAPAAWAGGTSAAAYAAAWLLVLPHGQVNHPDGLVATARCKGEVPLLLLALHAGSAGGQRVHVAAQAEQPPGHAEAVLNSLAAAAAAASTAAARAAAAAARPLAAPLRLLSGPIILLPPGACSRICSRRSLWR